MNKRISVVIPTYNAEKTLVELVERINMTLMSDYEFEVILVNDQSKDSSLELIKELSTKYDVVKGINLIENQGQQRATFVGMQHSTGDYVVILDDDLENNPEDIPKLLLEIEKGYDVVYALNKAIEKKSIIRNIGSICRDIIFILLTSLPRDKRVCSFRIIRKEISDAVVKSKVKTVYISMEILKKTSNVGNVYVDYYSNDTSNYSFKKLAILYLSIIINYSFLAFFVRDKYSQVEYEIVGEK